MVPYTTDPASHREGQVSGREPDPVPRCEHRGLTAVTICARKGAEGGHVRRPMFPPHTGTSRPPQEHSDAKEPEPAPPRALLEAGSAVEGKQSVKYTTCN